MKNVYSVGQVNSYIRNMFSQDFMLRSIYVRGEVSNCKYHSSGHLYFTLKDEKGAIACVMFSGYRKGLKFRLEEGQQVVALGSVEVYERDGKYQLYAREIIPDGAGFLYEVIFNEKARSIYLFRYEGQSRAAHVHAVESSFFEVLSYDKAHCPWTGQRFDILDNFCDMDMSYLYLLESFKCFVNFFSGIFYGLGDAGYKRCF